jgi:hypothetical protein
MDPVKFSELYNSFVSIEKTIHKGINNVFQEEKAKWQSLMQVYGSDLDTLPTADQQGKNKRFACKYCNKVYASAGGLYYHVQAIHMGIKYSCHLCSQQFTSKNHLHRHLTTIHVTDIEPIVVNNVPLV